MQQPKRIFVDCHVFDGSFQGTTTFIHGLYQEMAKDTSIDFYFAGNDTALLKSRFGTAPNMYFLEYKYHNKFLRLLWEIPAMIRKYKIDFAHFQYIAPPVKACKYIVTIHDVLFLDFPEYFPASYRLKNGFLFRQSAKKADIVTTVSPYSKTKIEQHFGLHDIVSTPNAVEEVFFEPYDKASLQAEVKSRFGIEDYIVYISRHEPRKNHRRLLSVFSKKLHETHQLLLIGDKALPDPGFETLLESLPEAIRSRVHLLHKVPFADLLLLLRAASASVYPSIAEGFGIPPLEAAAARVPSTCSDTTAMADFSALGDALFDPLDEADMEQKIFASLQATDSTAVAIAVREQFNWKRAADALKEVM